MERVDRGRAAQLSTSMMAIESRRDSVNAVIEAGDDEVK